MGTCPRTRSGARTRFRTPKCPAGRAPRPPRCNSSANAGPSWRSARSSTATSASTRSPATPAPPRPSHARLRALEEAGVVERRAHSERPLRYEYQLTEAGRDLAPVMRALLASRECGHEPAECLGSWEPASGRLSLIQV
ncbi:helix-turn-helix domain-containing protein [Streptomyces europaeiscabiei]|uniref:winged helix-turn-helix transcriptional regulator n=1 Tax=Streptomyces europaeiscabiei TaxID=146819 RepID=UPI002E2DD8B3|nr:helix-turn-helix domain-containing protein [Streptomyces europaeiscabiei]